MRRIREARGWSQEQLGLEADIHRTYISGIERGTRNATVVMVAKLAKTLKVSPGSLLDPP